AFVTKALYDNAKDGDADCPFPKGGSCLIVKLTNPGLPSGQHLIFPQGFIVDSTKAQATLCDLVNNNTTITYYFSDGLVITSPLGNPNASCSPTDGQTANSQNPTSTVPTTSDPVLYASFIAASTPPEPCSLGADVNTNN